MLNFEYLTQQKKNWKKSKIRPRLDINGYKKKGKKMKKNLEIKRKRMEKQFIKIWKRIEKELKTIGKKIGKKELKTI